LVGQVLGPSLAAQNQRARLEPACVFALNTWTRRGGGFTIADFETKTSEAIGLTDLIGQIESGGTLFFVGCTAGKGLGRQIGPYVRDDINIYMNCNRSGADGDYAQGFFFYMDEPITSRFEDYWIGVLDVQSGYMHNDMQINKNGTFKMIDK
jgi:hypothetical protein